MSFGILEAIGIATAVAAPEAAATTAAVAAPEAAAAAAPGLLEAIGNVGGALVGTEGVGAGGLSSLMSGGANAGSLSTIGSSLAPSLVTTALGQGIQGVQGAEASSQNQRTGRNLATANAMNDQVQSASANQTGAKLWGHAEGGPVALQNGDWVVPADVLSSIGNGSTNAGAQFLNEYFGLNDARAGSPT